MSGIHLLIKLLAGMQISLFAQNYSFNFCIIQTHCIHGTNSAEQIQCGNLGLSLHVADMHHLGNDQPDDLGMFCVRFYSG